MDIGDISKGTSLVFSNMKSSLKADDSGSLAYSISYKVYNGSNIVKSGNLSSQNITGNVFSYNAASTGNYKVVFTISASAIRSASLDNTGLVSSSIGATGSFSVSHYSPKDAFTLIGYDGIGLNYGTNNVVYFGPDEAVFKYGDEGLKISKEGIQQLYKGEWVKLGSV